MKQITVQALEAIYTGELAPADAMRGLQERATELLARGGCPG
jgi:hypothetical protein